MISWFRTKRVSISHHLPVPEVRQQARHRLRGRWRRVGAVRSREDLRRRDPACVCSICGAVGGGAHRQHRPGHRRRRTVGDGGGGGSASAGGGATPNRHRVVRVVQVVRIARRRNQFGVLVAPPGAEQQRPLQPRIGEVEDGEQVDVVTAGDAVGEGRAVRERRRPDQRRAEVGPDVGERLEGGLQVLQVRRPGRRRRR